MKDKKIDTFENLVKYFSEGYKKSNDSFFEKMAQDIVGFGVNNLAELENKEKSSYNEILEGVDLNPVKLSAQSTQLEETTAKDEEKNEEIKTTNKTEFGKYINEYILETELKDDFNLLMDKLEEDMKNPNDTLISTWIKNYKDFVDEHSLDEKLMFDFARILINQVYKYDIELEELYYGTNENSKEIESTNENDKISEEVEQQEDINKETASKESNTTTRNEKQEENKKTTEEADVTPEVSENLEEKEDINELNKPKEVNPNPESKNSEEKTYVGPPRIKIVSLEAPIKSKGKKAVSFMLKGATALALLKICASLSLGVVPTLLVAGGAILLNKMKKKNAKNKYTDKLKEILKKYDLDIVNEQELSTSEFKNKYGIREEAHYVIFNKLKLENLSDEDKKKIDKARYEETKKSLIEIGAMKEDNNETIDKNYKKNSLLKRIKGYFDKRVERLNKIENSSSYLEREKYKNAKNKYNNDQYIFDIDEEKSKNENPEEIIEEERGMHR